MCETIDAQNCTFDDITIDFDLNYKLKLGNLLREIYNVSVDKVKDNYAVKFHLKDDTIFAHASRRFASAEKLQIREIIDDLLARGIIKESTSLYCARMVPVRKKNGQLRMCVDLRPLNDRVIKQKYPFPLIEDCIARLGNKNVFTLVDLKDGFHQIRVHEDFTKYLSFATPDGQFEYNYLPFTFCELPAEFQKRLVNILQFLMRDNKIIVYIDDIMITIETVKANLEILRQVLIILLESTILN